MEKNDNANKRLPAGYESCTACGACAAKCPKGAITMKENVYGFLYPVIDQDLCIRCGACDHVCPVVSPAKKENTAHGAYAGYASDETLRKQAASGGIFSAIAVDTIRKNGTVFGAAMEEESYRVFHKEAENETSLKGLTGSKYVQSAAWESFRAVKERLTENIPVFFSGTPCQVAALKAYLGRPYENLTTMDIVCHGVGNSRILTEDICFMTKMRHPAREGVRVFFRSKTEQNGKCGSGILKNGEKISDYSSASSPYYHLYLSGMLFRESCYRCPYAGGSRPGDITAGDYWGIEKLHPELSSEAAKGISCILANTDRGENILKELAGRGDLVLFRSTPDNAAKFNAQLQAPARRPAGRDRLLHRYCMGGFAELVKEYEKKRKMEPFRKIAKGMRIIAEGIRKEVKK